MYRNEIVNNVIYGRVTQQSTEPLCGIMALAFAFSCFFGVSPINVNYDITKAREHLKICFESGNISQFPLVLETNHTNWIYTYLENQRRLSCEHVSERESKKLEHSILPKSILDQDKDKNANHSNKGKSYQTQQRKSLSPQQIEDHKAKERHRKSEQRKLLTAEERQIIKTQNRNYQAQKRKKPFP